MRCEGEREHTDDHLDRRGTPPSPEVLPGRPGRAGHGADEKAGVVPVVLHVPAGDELTHDHRDERNRVLEAWAIVDRLRVLVDSKQAY